MSRIAPGSRRAGAKSTPNVAWVVFNAVFFQERYEFSLEIMFLVMLRLIGDVPEGGSDLSGSDGEGAVAFLPFEMLEVAGFVHPARRSGFNFAHCLTQRKSRRQG